MRQAIIKLGGGERFSRPDYEDGDVTKRAATSLHEPVTMLVIHRTRFLS